MAQTITLTLPDKLYGPIQRMAQATDQSLENLLLTAIQASLPSLRGIPAELIEEFMLSLDDDTLQNQSIPTYPQ